jgi:transcriptional regulator GlxA family with amidase domain
VDPIRAGSGSGAELVWLDPAPLAGKDFQNVVSAATHPDAGRVLLRIVEEWRDRRPGAELVLRGLIWELMVLVRRGLPARRRSAARTGGAEYERLAPALQILTRRYASQLEIGGLARSCALSEPHFRRLFKQTLGKSPRAYWNDLRLRMAASLLRGTRRSVLEISQSVGFETLSSFDRLFKTCFGKSPRAWRLADD